MNEFLSTQATPIGMLLVAIATGAKGLWVFGRTFDAMENDRDFYRDSLIKALNLTERAVASKEKEG